MNNMNKTLSPTEAFNRWFESWIVAGVREEAVERGDVVVGDERGLDGVDGGDGVVGTSVEDVEPETIHIVKLNHNFTLKNDLG